MGTPRRPPGHASGATHSLIFILALWLRALRSGRFGRYFYRAVRKGLWIPQELNCCAKSHDVAVSSPVQFSLEIYTVSVRQSPIGSSTCGGTAPAYAPPRKGGKNRVEMNEAPPSLILYSPRCTTKIFIPPFLHEVKNMYFTHTSFHHKGSACTTTFQVS